MQQGKGKQLCLAGVLCLILLAIGYLTAGQEINTKPVQAALQTQLKVTAADQKTEFENVREILLEEYTDVCTIREAGAYRISGALKGTIEVDAEEQVVHLILSNVSVEANQGTALHILSAGKVVITLEEGTVNTLQDSAHYPKDAKADACIYSECDLTINGSGMLNVYGYYEDAVHTKDVLKILGGSFFVQSKRDGFRGNDGIILRCHETTVQSERNGWSTTKTGKPGKGNIEVLSGSHSVIGGQYAISCAADLYMEHCSAYLMGVVEDQKVGGAAYVAEGVISK